LTSVSLTKSPVRPVNVGNGRDRPHIPATDFDPIAVGDKIAEHLAEADKADAVKREHSIAAGTLLLDVHVNHPEHLDAICDRIGLKRSRRAELLMIARGRKTPEQSKAQNKARVKKHRAKKKAAALQAPRPSENPLHRPVTDDPSQPENQSNDVDPNASVEAVKVAQVEAEAQTASDSEPKPTSKPAKSCKNSLVALVQFKIAVDHWIMQLSADDTVEALAYAKTVGEQHIAKTTNTPKS
jgi:hypothetical protein